MSGLNKPQHETMDQAATSLTERAALARILDSEASAQEKIAAHRRLIFGGVKMTLAELEPRESRPRATKADHVEFLRLHDQLSADLAMLGESEEDDALCRAYCKNHAAGIRQFVMEHQAAILPEASDHAGLRSTDEHPAIVLVDLLAGAPPGDSMHRIKDIFRSQFAQFELMLNETEMHPTPVMEWLWMLALGAMLTFVVTDRTYDAWFELLARIFNL